MPDYNDLLKSSRAGILILTHRKGVACAAIKVHQGTFFEALNQLQKQLSELITNVCAQNLYETLHIFSSAQSTSALKLSQNPTAENLASIYQEVSSQLWEDEHSVNNIFVGIGPGSFTGLRLACAFANGLCAGHQRNLWQIECTKHENLSSYLPPELHEPWQNYSQTHAQVKDEWSIPVHIFDVYVALQKIPTAIKTDELRPAYGQLPGPVRKLLSADCACKEQQT